MPINDETIAKLYQYSNQRIPERNNSLLNQAIIPRPTNTVAPIAGANVTNTVDPIVTPIDPTVNNNTAKPVEPKPFEFIASPETVVTPTTYDATKWIPKESDLVSGQVNSITQSGSPLMELAKNKGLQQANQRGLLNSSIGIGAAQKSVIETALPMAQGNAEVLARAGSQNATAENTASSFNAQQTQHTNEFNASNIYNANKDVFLKNAEAALKQLEYNFQGNQQTQRMVGDTMGYLMEAMQEINTNTNMDQKSKDYSYQQIFKLGTEYLIPLFKDFQFVGIPENFLVEPEETA